MNITERCLNIEIRGIYDGICVKYYPHSDEFVWRDIAIERSTQEERDTAEANFRKQFKNQEL